MSEKNEEIADSIRITCIEAGYGVENGSEKWREEIINALDSKDEEKHSLLHQITFLKGELAVVLIERDARSNESAQLRAEVERLRLEVQRCDVDNKGIQQGGRNIQASMQEKLTSQSLLIEKLRKALEKIARDSDTSGPYTPNYMCGSWEASLAKEALALLPQDEKKERG